MINNIISKLFVCLITIFITIIIKYYNLGIQTVNKIKQKKRKTTNQTTPPTHTHTHKQLFVYHPPPPFSNKLSLYSIENYNIQIFKNFNNNFHILLINIREKSKLKKIIYYLNYLIAIN
jgi:hypothetical protein